MWATDVTINFGSDDTDWKAHVSDNDSYTDSDSRTWTRTYSANNNSSGQAGYSQFGNASNACTSLVLTATAGSDMTVTAFSVTMAGASGGKSPTTGTIYLYKRTSGGTETQLATASVSGSSSVTCSITSSEAFSSTDILKVSYVGTAKAIRISSLSYSYTTGGGGGGSSVDAPTFSPAAGAVVAGTTITLTQASADQIRYTTDGTNPTKTTGTVYSAPIAITTPTTIKAIAVEGDDVSSVATAAYTISVTAPEYNLASSGNYLAGTGLTLTSAGNTIYYNMTTDGSTPSNPTSSSTEYTSPISLSSGTVKIKAIAYDAYGNTSSVASLTVNGIAPATLPFNWAGGGKTALTAVTGVVGGGLGGDYDSGTHNPYLVKYDTDGDFIEIFTNAQPLKVSVDVKMIGGKTTSKIKVQESTNGVEFSDVEELTISGAQNDIVNLVTTEDFATTTRVIKLLFVKGANVGVGPISILGGSLPASLNASGYATFASTYALDFSDDSEYSAWQITGVSGSAITFSQITGTVAAGTGVLLKGTASSSINIPVAASGTDISGTNKLEGITSATAVAADTYYGLSGNVFKKVSEGTVPAGKALLPAGAIPASARELTFVFEGDETTGVKTIDNGQWTIDNGAVYDLQGRKVTKPVKGGLYIVNGKKVIK